MPKADRLMITPESVELAQNIMKQLSELRPEHSFSFLLSEDGVAAIGESLKIAEWGIGGNKPKLKTTALEILTNIGESAAGDPVNVNFTEYEIKAIGEVFEVLGKALGNHKEGFLT